MASGESSNPPPPPQEDSNGNPPPSQEDSNGNVAPPSDGPERVRFPRIEARRFYSCMCCSNHILDVPRPVSNRVAVYLAERRVVCNSHQLVNVWFDSPDNSWIYDDDGSHVLSVYCNQCNEPIGYRMLTQGRAYDEPVLLYRSRLLFWDGSFTIYADTYRVADVDND